METVPLAHTDFYPQLNKIAALKPDILVSCFVSVSSGVAFVKQFQEVGIKASHTALYYPSRPEFLDQAGEYSNYLLWIQSVYFDPKNNETQAEFVKKYEKKFKSKANLDAALGYDGIYNVLDSVKRAGSLDPNDIIEALRKLDREGIIGRYVFDPENHEIKDGPEYIPLPGAQIINGEAIYIWPKKFANGEYKAQPWTK
jgi:branched-chain amino acid transport system substrate-binding protein